MPVHQVQPPHPNQTHRATLALTQGQRAQAQAPIPVRALTVRVHGNGMTNADGHEVVVSPADLMGLRGSAAAAQGDDHSESADGDAHPRLYCPGCCVYNICIVLSVRRSCGADVIETVS